MNKFFALLIAFTALTSCQAQNKSTKVNGYTIDSSKKYNALTEQEQRVLLDKATDYPYTGEYYQKKDAGIYICRMCNNPLYHSTDKFDAHCGWPSFDQEIKGSVSRVSDADGYRIEIICMNCNGHLGHVFEGEGYTDKNIRHCVNTSSLRFVPQSDIGNLPVVIR
jgi:methionine-R-sulfoxide reductase